MLLWAPCFHLATVVFLLLGTLAHCLLSLTQKELYALYVCMNNES